VGYPEEKQPMMNIEKWPTPRQFTIVAMSFEVHNSLGTLISSSLSLPLASLRIIDSTSPRRRLATSA
jgi:hypothetical protein